MNGREYFGTFVIFGIAAVTFLWFQFFALPRLEALRREEENKDASTSAPESHPKSSE